MDEIARNEKDLAMIATVAQTLMSRVTTLAEANNEQQLQIDQHCGSESRAIANSKGL